MIKFTTINIDGVEVKREFKTIQDVLKNWWNEEGTDLPSNDDKVVTIEIDGYAENELDYLKKFGFGAVIDKLSEIHWNSL